MAEMKSVLEALAALDITIPEDSIRKHEAAKDAHAHRAALTSTGGIDGYLACNMFLKDKKKKLFLVVRDEETVVNLKILAKMLVCVQGCVVVFRVAFGNLFLVSCL
jgi:hypothetical protein